VVPSTDGHGELPQRQIDEGLARDALVHYGFDNDAGGATLWAQVKEAYPRAKQGQGLSRPLNGVVAGGERGRLTAVTHVFYNTCVTV